MSKKKILFLVQLPPPVHGTSLMNKTIIESEEVKSTFDMDIIPIQMAKSSKDIGNFSFGKVINTIKMYLKLIRNLIQNKYDLVYFTISPLSFAFYKDLILVFLLKMFNKKIVYHLHGKGISKKTSKSRFQKALYAYVFKNTEVIILAEVLFKDIETVCKNKPRILPNGVPKVALQLEKKEDSTLTFIYLSNLVISKGVLVFIEALKELKARTLNFKALIVGNSADVSIEELTQLVNKYDLTNMVSVVGPAYGMEKYKKLQEANVFVLPTFYKNECFPLTIIEAFQSGLAVISTNNGAIPDMVKNDINGYLVEINNVADLTTKMFNCIENPKTILKMGENNINEYEEKYTKDIFIAKFIEIINTILKKQQ